MTQKVKIGGVGFHVATSGEAEACDLVVCAYAGFPTMFTDNVETTCAWCGTAIIHRPHAPAKPPKVCFGCAMSKIESSVQ